MANPMTFEEEFAELHATGEQTPLAPSLTESQRSRAIGFRMLMGLFGEVITPEEAQEAIVGIDAQQPPETSDHAPQMDRGQELIEVLELADEFTAAIGPPKSLPPLPNFKNIIDSRT